MTIYAYKCRKCGTCADSTKRGDSLGPCPTCDGTLTRLFVVNLERPMMAHFNVSVGKEISSNRQFDDELKRKSAEQSERTGVEARYVRHDPADAKALGVTHDGLDTTNAQRVAKGLKPIVPDV